MAVAIRASGTYHAQSTGNYTFTTAGGDFPSGVQAGDLIMWLGLFFTAGATFADNIGGSYTLVASQMAYRKVASGGETQLTITTTGNHHGMVIALSGVDTTAPIATSIGGSSTTTSLSSFGATAVGRTGTLLIWHTQGQSTTAGANPFIGFTQGSPYTVQIRSYVGGAAGAWREGNVYWRNGTETSGTTPTTPTETISTAPASTSRTSYLYYVQPPDPYIPPRSMLMGVGR